MQRHIAALAALLLIGASVAAGVAAEPLAEVQATAAGAQAFAACAATSQDPACQDELVAPQPQALVPSTDEVPVPATDGFTAHIVPVGADGARLVSQDGFFVFNVTSYLGGAGGEYQVETAMVGGGFFLRIDHYAPGAEPGSTTTHYQGSVADGVWTISVPITDLPPAAMIDVFVERYGDVGDGRSSHHFAPKEALLAAAAPQHLAADVLDSAGLDGAAKLFTPLFVGAPDAAAEDGVESTVDAITGLVPDMPPPMPCAQDLCPADAVNATVGGLHAVARQVCSVPVLRELIAAPLAIDCEGEEPPQDPPNAGSTNGVAGDGFTAHIVPTAEGQVLTAVDGAYVFNVTSYLGDKGEYHVEAAFETSGFFLRIEHYTADGASSQTATHYQGVVADGIWTIKVPVGDLPAEALLDVFVERYPIAAEATDGRSSHYLLAKEQLLANAQPAALAADVLDSAGADGQAKLFTPLFVGNVDPAAMLAALAATALDSDGDGVLDPDDACSETPEGESVDAAGCADSQKDTDGDGVSDDVDQCPDTAAEATVDADGCAASQRDSDADGVTDDKDACPGTTPGAAVDAVGCADAQKDSDGDGVSDDVDACPATPSEAAVDTDGCADAQKDSDDDGVSDDVDACPSTPAGASVDADGCADSEKDTDGDQVNDDQDTCPGTADGATVDADGCSTAQTDADGDGVMDDADLCDDTAQNATVNGDGCSAAQRDSDGDLIMDDADQCPDTPTGATVDSDGCADSQKDSDADGVKDDADECAATPSGTDVDARGCTKPVEYDAGSGSGAGDSTDSETGETEADASDADETNAGEASDSGDVDADADGGSAASDAAADEKAVNTPGFGLLAAISALGAIVLIARRK